MPCSQPRRIPIPSFVDERGTLAVVDWAECLPFAPKRLYYIFDVAPGAMRGGHAHRVEEEFIVALHGAFTLIVDDGRTRRALTLDRRDSGVYVPAGVWHELVDFRGGAVCAVLGSRVHRDNDYVRDYPQFLGELAEHAR